MDIHQFLETALTYLRDGFRADLYEWAWAIVLAWTALFLLIALLRKERAWLGFPVLVSLYLLFHGAMVLATAHEVAAGSSTIYCTDERDDFCVDEMGEILLREFVIVRDADGFNWVATGMNALRDGVAWCQYVALLLGVAGLFGLLVASPFWLFGLVAGKRPEPAEA
jgi:hypothetical protein